MSELFDKQRNAQKSLKNAFGVHASYRKLMKMVYVLKMNKKNDARVKCC